MSIINYQLSIIACLMLVACADSGYVDIPREGWTQGDTVTLRADREAADSATLVVRIDHTYAYNKLWLTVNGAPVTVQTDHRHGVGVHEATATIAADSVLRITHRMPDELLQGVISLGLCP